MNGQASLELMLWAGAGMVFFAGSLLAFGNGLSRMGEAQAGIGMHGLISEILASADSVGEHGSRVARVAVPEGMTGFSSGEADGAWWVWLAAGNVAANRTVPYRLVIQPESMLGSPGTHYVRISRVGGVVFVEEL